jgi:hypothetical protein
VTNDVDTLATALYATTDDMLREHPDLAPWRPPVGITPRLSDAELVTLTTMQAILGYTSEAGWANTVTAPAGDKNYFGRGFECELSEHGVQLLRPARGRRSAENARRA